MSNFDTTIAKIRAFRDARDWMQFHNPKNLAISINLESAELLEHFQWTSMEESEAHARAAREEIAEEMADVAIYLFELADNLGIDLLSSVDAKLAKNESKYPVAKAKGSAAKYNQL
jgi:NTP pyrophosphatase (non-canonical NTP hydrolase)